MCVLSPIVAFSVEGLLGLATQCLRLMVCSANHLSVRCFYHHACMAKTPKTNLIYVDVNSRSVDALPLGVPDVTDMTKPAQSPSTQEQQVDRTQSGEGGSLAAIGGSFWSAATSPPRFNMGGVQRQALVGVLVLGALYWTQMWEGVNLNVNICP